MVPIRIHIETRRVIITIGSGADAVVVVIPKSG
jgi:hypothetical protein